MIDFDADVVDALEDIAKLADVSPSQVVNVMLATKIYNDKRYQEDRDKLKTKKAKWRAQRGYVSAHCLGEK
jgi:hypothetical protein